MLRRLAPLAAVVLSAALLTGCSTADDEPDRPAPSSTPSATAPAPTPTLSAAPAVPSTSTVASVTGRSVEVHDAPDGAVTTTLDNPQASGAPLVLLVLGQEGDWVNVSVAQRPNGSSGWVPASAVTLTTTSYALVASTTSNTLVLYDAGVEKKSFPVATGTGGTPTPTGSFYLTELLAPTNQGYGPFAYGLSAFSDALNSFGGGPGQIGLHGTDDEASIGQAASHGCIRLSNADISELAAMLPLGTPITIT
ncbi:lipoprotein-anchoring transpeptidase ErfK/SrfK [Frigoribacterium sp. PhB107]|uniref:L,D-transpeptidase family protein n=1 Tax=Frigoribacterium sp. PhB107 TaxID=2485172 RepID=UPI000FB14828|nr:L,D-transpeptidase [Frigoribacterium sp. PhB107]ROP78744.1 lipoprotein-anchoring transpeptidase ErfK/SrfK [Frigoribacterium sp. PhB107]